MNLTDEFTAMVVGLQTANIEFAVCGAMAMGMHGFPRFTKDIDFLVQEQDLPAILDIATKRGFDDEVEVLSLGPTTRRTCEIRRINKFQGEDHLMLDLLLVIPPLHDV